MFLRRDYRDQAIGLVAAFALLITGVVVTGAVAEPSMEKGSDPFSGEFVSDSGFVNPATAHQTERP